MRMKSNHFAIKKMYGLNSVTDSKEKENASYTGVSKDGVSKMENCLEKKMKEDVSGIFSFKYESIKKVCFFMVKG